MTSRNMVTAMVMCVGLCAVASMGRAQAITQPDVKGFLRFEQVSKDFRLGVNVVRPFDNVLLLGADKALVRSTDEGRSWKPILSPLQRKDITAIVVHDDDIVVGSASGGLYRSTDRGLYWQEFGTEPDVLRTKSLIRTRDRYVVLNESGACYGRRVADGNWSALALPSRCNDVVSFDDKTWFICQDGAVLADEGDGPEPRGVVPVSNRSALVAVNDLLAVVLDTVVVVFDDDGDSLATWALPTFHWTACAALEGQLLLGGRSSGVKKLNLETGEITFAFAGPAELENISALAVSSDTVVVGTSKGEGRCYVVSQSKLQWHALNPTGQLSTFDATAIAISNGQVYVAAREEGVHAGDAKRTFLKPIHDGYEDAIITQFEPLRNEMLVVGRRSGIWRLKSGSGRLEWFTRTLPSSFDYFAAVIGTRVVVGLNEGVIVWSDDDGQTWSQSSDSVPRINSMSTVGKSIYLSTFEGLFRSEDNGETWRAVLGPWHTKNVMWATGATDTLFVTTTDATYRELAGQPVRRMHADLTQPAPTPFTTILLYRGLLFATGAQGVFASADVGETWQQKTIEGSLATINQFFYNDYYYVFTDLGHLWRSPIPSR